MKRLEFAGFTSCENFRCYCGPILRGVKGMEKKKKKNKKYGIRFYFLVFFPILVGE